jgi:dolichol-phosphate mannosyltransferase
MKILIVMPTYNEKENIEAIINDIFLKNQGFEINVLVVDDNSPDGTQIIIKKIIQEKFNGRLFLIEREGKQGLASAYMAGFKWGIANGYDILIEMDADFSHNPDYLSEMIIKSNEYDCVVGSRNIKYGKVRGWGFLRNIISKGGSLYSRIILNIPVKDLTGGFNLWKKEVLEKIGIDNIISKGYSFQIELKYRAHRLGFKLTEIPIIFDDRIKGESKMSKNIFFEALLNIWKLRFIEF